MSEFLFILPAWWQQIDPAVMDTIGMSSISYWVEMTNNTDLTDALRAQNAIPQDKTVVESRLFNNEILAVTLD